MIITTIQECGRYKAVSPLLQKAFEWLQKTDLSTLAEGRGVILSEKGIDVIYYMRSSYTTKESAQAGWEAHKKYIDIQLLIDGSETIEAATLSSAELAKNGYKEENDFISIAQAAAQQKVLLVPEQLAVFFPEDAHKPGMHGADNTAHAVKKFVVKVAV